MSHLAAAASPAAAPMASHQRGSSLASSRMIRYRVRAHSTKDGVVVDIRCIAARYTRQVALASAASTWPARPAPSSRDIAAVSSTSTPMPSAGSTRSPASVFPNARASSRASSGVSTGWST